MKKVNVIKELLAGLMVAVFLVGCTTQLEKKAEAEKPSSLYFDSLGNVTGTDSGWKLNVEGKEEAVGRLISGRADVASGMLSLTVVQDPNAAIASDAPIARVRWAIKGKDLITESGFNYTKVRDTDCP